MSKNVSSGMPFGYIIFNEVNVPIGIAMTERTAKQFCPELGYVEKTPLYLPKKHNRL